MLDHIDRIADTDLLATLLRAKDITGEHPHTFVPALQMLGVQGMKGVLPGACLETY